MYPRQRDEGARHPWFRRDERAPHFGSAISGERDIRAAMASAAMNAILDVSRAESGEALIDPSMVERALVVLVAILMEADPRVRTSKDVQKAADIFAKLVQKQAAFLLERYERTGERGWDVVR